MIIPYFNNIMNSNLIQIIAFNTFIWIIRPSLEIGLSILYYMTYAAINLSDFILSIFVTECE